jgi:hypothetical protein
VGYFPRSAAANEQVFFAGLTELLASYPVWVQDAVSNVRSGLPAHHKFMPTIAEVRDYCEKLVLADRKHRELIDQWKRPRLPPPVDRSNRPTYEELKAKYGPDWGITAGQPSNPRKELAELCRDHGVSVDDIPEAKREKNAQRLGKLADKLVSTLAEKIDDWDVWP